MPVSIHPIAAVEYPFDPLEEGDEIQVGNVSLRCSTRLAIGPSTAVSR